MKRTLLLVCLLLAAGCQKPAEQPVEEEQVPVGPGSDSTVLIPPDTPQSPRP